MQHSNPVRIGYMHSHTGFPYWATFAQGVRSRAVELGAELCLPISDPQDDLPASVGEVISQRPDVIIVQHSVVDIFPGAGPMLDRAGIPVVGVEVTPDIRYACAVRADEAAGAHAVVTHLFDQLGGRGKVVNIPGPRLTDRQRVFQKLLHAYPGIELAHEGSASQRWSPDEGAQVMEAALAAHPDIRGVFAHSDRMAIGACAVIAAHGLTGQITVVGFDAEPEGLVAIRDGRLAATIYRGMYGVGRQAVDTALRAATRDQLPAELRVPVTLITATNLIEAMIDTTIILPGLLSDLITSNRSQRQLQQETIAAQRRLIQELSTPVIPISESVLIVPLIGAIDSQRAQQVLDAMLRAIEQHRAQALIIDITGIAVVDTGVAHYLMQAARAVQLLGAQVVLVGISPEVAQTLVGLGAGLGDIVTRATLRDGFAYAQRQLGRR
jgi:anti-anti-sigma factor